MINGGDENVYIGYFENRYDEQWVFTYDRRTERGELRGGDVDWGTVFEVEDDGSVPDLILSPEEWLWLRSCWCAATDTNPRREADAGHHYERASAGGSGTYVATAIPCLPSSRVYANAICPMLLRSYGLRCGSINMCETVEPNIASPMPATRS